MKHDVAAGETAGVDLADLRAFCLTVDLGSITAAAKTLGETKGSVSRRLTRLERALGAVLLRRSPRLVQATEDGLAYRLRVGRALELLDDAAIAVQHARATPRGHLRVTAPYDLGVSLIAPLVAGFAARCPEVSVEMVLTEAMLDFDAHQIDVALRVAATLQDSALIAHRLQHIAVGLFASPGYLRKHGAVRTPDELSQHRLLMMRAVRGQAVLVLQPAEGKERVRLKVHAAISASEFSFLQEAALADGGIALLPVVVAQREVAARRLVPVLPEYQPEGGADLYLVHQGSRFLPPKVQAFREYVLEALAQRGPGARGR
jgi:DNA-binding transcriptional LysR family regulator